MLRLTSSWTPVASNNVTGAAADSFMRIWREKRTNPAGICRKHNETKGIAAEIPTKEADIIRRRWQRRLDQGKSWCSRLYFTTPMFLWILPMGLGSGGGVESGGGGGV